MGVMNYTACDSKCTKLLFNDNYMKRPYKYNLMSQGVIYLSHYIFTQIL